jgi:hypothetical protein
MNTPEQFASTVSSERWDRYVKLRNKRLVEYGRTHEFQPVDEVDAVMRQAWDDTEKEQ